jgi:eukaryotic-like serine/threonine-protein kinase
VSSQVIAGRYDLSDRLGFGGMSTVHLAFDRRLERQVAVKVLAEHLADDPQFVSRFRREALAAARLVHPNIVQVFDFGLDEPTGRHFIVMEHIRGQSGAELLRDHGRLDLQSALAMLNHACRGLEHAHRHGVVHRDVKPGNLLRSEDGLTKLADFGIAKATGDSASRITQVGSVLGTAAYLSPEQAAGEDATARSDLYGLGVVAYQFLAGRLPYEAQSLTELALKQQRERPPLLDQVDPEIPSGVAQAVARALELEPSRRFASADEMREALAAGAAGDDVAAPEPTASTRMLAAEPTAATRMAPAAAPASPPTRARRLAPTPGPVAPAPLGDPAYAGAEPAGRERRSGRRVLTMLLVLLLLAIVAAAAYVAATSGGGVELGPVDGESTEEVVRNLRDLIDENTR